MIAVDTNILVYAHRGESPKHRAATKALLALGRADDLWGIPVFVIGEFVRVVTHPSIHTPPSPEQEAVATVDEMLRVPNARLLMPGERYWPLLRETLVEAGARGNLVLDAQVVALCKENGVDEILTEDRDFVRFSGIRVRRLED